MGAFLSCRRWLLQPGGREGDGRLDQADGAQVEATQRGESGLHRGGDVFEAVLGEADAGESSPPLSYSRGDCGFIRPGNVCLSSRGATSATLSSLTLMSLYPPNPPR